MKCFMEGYGKCCCDVNYTQTELEMDTEIKGEFSSWYFTDLNTLHYNIKL